MLQKNWTELIKPNRPGMTEPGGPVPAQATATVVQPLERGFGLTLGNALRRVLLSSLAGCGRDVDPDRRRSARILVDPGCPGRRHRHCAGDQAIALRMHGDQAKRIRCKPRVLGEVTAGRSSSPTRSRC